MAEGRETRQRVSWTFRKLWPRSENMIIWFTDYRHLNDPSELIHGIEMAHDVARVMATGVDERVRLFLETLVDMFSHRNFSATLEFFIASFSRERDDLGQWRAYADDGRGFAIGFAPHMFRIVENPPKDKLGEFVGPVLYDIGEVYTRHHLSIEEVASIVLDTLNANADLVRDKAVGSFMQDMARNIIASPLIWNCLTSKHPGDPAGEKTFFNDTLGKPYETRGNGRPWEELRDRAAKSHYERGTVPQGALSLGVDCQFDRIEWQLVGFGREYRRFVVDYGTIGKHISEADCQNNLSRLLDRRWPNFAGHQMGISLTAIDANFATDDVLSYARRYAPSQRRREMGG